MSTIEQTTQDNTEATEATTWYAWSTIDYGAKHDEKNRELIISRNVIKLGDKVSPSKFGGEDSDQWKELVANQVVRPYELPNALIDPNTSPQKIISAQLRAMQEGIDTGIIDAVTLNTVLPVITKAKYPLEGDNEITETGEVVPAQGTPPAATNSL